jgi:phosphoribosyl 1,2-cyclic phosphodiesterase
MIEVCSLSSGSNGNCFYVRTGSDRFLVDAGISCRQIKQRLRIIGSDIEEISGIFITHEHSDHIRGLQVLLKHHSIPIYMTEKTYWRCPVQIDDTLLNFIGANDHIPINGTVIQSMPKSHDAIDPVLFCIHFKGKKISIVTDAGHICQNVVNAVRDAHIVFIESNYDDNMLWQGPYPPQLKQRVAGTYGHLSNLLAAQLIYHHASPELSHIFLSHLSENNNHPDIAINTLLHHINQRNDLNHVQTLLTSRHNVSEVVKIKV